MGDSSPAQREFPPFLMRPNEALGIKAAATMYGRSVSTIRRLVTQHGIGRQAGPNAPVEVSMPAMEMLMHGDFEALELLRAGDRNHPLVQRYLAFLGLIEMPQGGSQS